MNGTPVYGERVVIVEVNGGHVNVRTGSISSNGSSHLHADNRRTTLVHTDEELHPPIETQEDGHEKYFKVDDIHLLKEQEAKRLASRRAAEGWFGLIYQDRLVEEIQRALRRVTRARTEK